MERADLAGDIDEADRAKPQEGIVGEGIRFSIGIGPGFCFALKLLEVFEVVAPEGTAVVGGILVFQRRDDVRMGGKAAAELEKLL